MEIDRNTSFLCVKKTTIEPSILSSATVGDTSRPLHCAELEQVPGFGLRRFAQKKAAIKAARFRDIMANIT